MLYYAKEELIKKLIVWKMISILTTVIVCSFWIDSFLSALGLAVALSFTYNIVYFTFNRIPSFTNNKRYNNKGRNNYEEKNFRG